MRLIDADALKETIVTNVYPVTDYFNSRDYGMFWTGGIEKAIDEQPTIEPERKKGHWEEDDKDKWRCSACGKGNVYAYSWDKNTKDWTILQDNYCPNCGADMRGEEHE